MKNNDGMVRPTHNPMDKFLKLYGDRFCNILLKKLGYNIRINRICPNELIHKSNEYRADFIGYSTKDQKFILMESESGKHKNEDDERYTNYGKFIRDKYHKCVDTIVISIAEENDRTIYYKIKDGICYPIDLRTFNKFNGDKTYERIKNKDKLEEKDIADLTILPIMNNSEPVGQTILKTCKLTKST